MSTPRLFLGELGGNRLLRWDVGVDDAGQAVMMRGESDPVAPAGPGGECIFTALYLVCTLHDPDAVEPFDEIAIEVTPIVDGLELETQTVTLDLTDERVTHHVELGISIPLIESMVEQGRFAPRGTWFSARVVLDALPPGFVDFEGTALEYDVVRESIAAQTVTPA